MTFLDGVLKEDFDYLIEELKQSPNGDDLIRRQLNSIQYRNYDLL